MADVQLFQRSGLPPAQVGQAKPPYQLADQSGQKQFGQTLAKFSGDIFDSLVKTRAANEEAEFQGGVNTSIESFKTYVAANPNASFDDLQKERDRVMAEIKTASGKATTGIGRGNNARWVSENEGLISQRLQTSMEAVASEQELTRSEIQIEGFINNLDEKGLTDHYAKTVESGLYLSEVADARLKNEIEVMRVAKQAMAVENIKPLMIKAVSPGDKTDGYKALNGALNQLVADGVLDKATAAEADKKLGDWLDSYVSGRNKQAEEEEKQTTHQIYQDLTKSIVGGNLSYDDIEQSKLLKADKELWLGDEGYIRKSYEKSPIKSTPKGHDKSFNAVYDAATIKISPKEAYDVLLKARFVDKSITDEQFKWAVDKIENPYPKHMVEDIDAIYNSNIEGEAEIGGETINYNTWYKSDKERNKKVNESFLAWVDHQLEQGKFPTRKEMYAISSQYHVEGGTLYSIGEVIERGGKDYEVVGFDDNGAALVEPVE